MFDLLRAIVMIYIEATATACDAIVEHYVEYEDVTAIGFHMPEAEEEAED